MNWQFLFTDKLLSHVAIRMGIKLINEFFSRDNQRFAYVNNKGATAQAVKVVQKALLLSFSNKQPPVHSDFYVT